MNASSRMFAGMCASSRTSNTLILPPRSSRNLACRIPATRLAADLVAGVAEDAGDRADRVAVFLSLPVGENRPAHQVGVDLTLVIALGSVRPTLGNTLAEPALVLQL